jgi:hypothetical protein
MPQHFRHYWGPQSTARFNFQWSIIRHDSFVVVTASEGPGYDVGPAPQRFVGDSPFIVCNVAPHDGGVTFMVVIGGLGGITNQDRSYIEDVWGKGPLNLWTDITVFDGSDQWGQN